MKVVCLSSGGLDSSVLLFMLKKKKYELLPLFVDYGQKSLKMELRSYKMICRKLRLKPTIMRLDQLKTIKLFSKPLFLQSDPAFFPNRNLLLLTIGAAYGYYRSAKVVSIGLLDNIVFSDQTKDFINSAEQIISISLGHKIKILAPFATLDKREVIALANKYKIPIGLTYSCHMGKKIPCGKCSACRERIMAQSSPIEK